MINVSVGTATSRVKVIVPSTMTLREVFEQESVTYDGSLIYFNGKVVDDIDTALDEYTLKDNNMLTAIVKAASAR